MDLRDKALVFALFLSICVLRYASCAGVFRVRSKFSGLRHHIDRLREHDERRHGRLLAGVVDLPLGGSELVGVYYTEIWIGNPAKHFFVQVDTGSDQLWVNCVQCQDCPRKSNLGMELTLYDPMGSTTGSLVSCNDNLCSVLYSGQNSGCAANIPCRFSLRYADGSTSSGYFMEDHIHYNRVIGDFQTSPVKTNVVFGCSVRETGLLNAKDLALDGIMGFGQSDTSIISQLASSGKVNKIFCDTPIGTPAWRGPGPTLCRRPFSSNGSGERGGHAPIFSGHRRPFVSPFRLCARRERETLGVGDLPCS